MAKAYETSKKKKGNPYVATGLRAMQRQIKEALKNPETKQRYLETKKRFRIGTVSEKKLRDAGLEGEEIKEYYQREIDIITGAYENERNQQFIENYKKAAKKMGISEVTIKHFEEAIKGVDLRDVVRDLKGDIELAQIHYISSDKVQEMTNKMSEEKRESEKQDIEDTLNSIIINYQNDEENTQLKAKEKAKNKIVRNMRKTKRRIDKFGV